jgi:2-methylisocitrate lyase-like PEP mutase family enzyme
MSAQRPDAAAKRRAFFELHRGGCFVIPNPWDIGSALYLQSLGFKALATTSSGFAWSRGRPDGAVTREAALSHLSEIVAATDPPVSADFQNGFGHEARDVADSVRLAVETGIAGLSIEDSTGDAGQALYDLDTAVARVRAARDAIDRSGAQVLLVARAECFLVGRPDLDETLARLKAYARAGADCLFAPGARSPDQIRALVAGVAPKPVNLLVGFPSELSVTQIAAFGVRRISVGGALARSAWGGFMRAAVRMARQGRFDGSGEATPTHDELDSLFQQAPH